MVSPRGDSDAAGFTFIVPLHPGPVLGHVVEKWRSWVKDIAAKTDKDTSSFALPQRLSKFDGMHVFEALSASGLRSLRYFKEVPGI